MKKNLILIYTYTFLSTFILFYSCDTLFYLEKGISSNLYILFVFISYFINILLNIPAGILADKYNKKYILFIGNFLFLISILLFIYSKSYLMFVVAVIISSIDNAITNGVADSLLYDSKNEKDKFSKILFNESVAYNVSYMLAMILGGIVAKYYAIVYTYYLTIIPTCLNFIIILFIKNPEKKIKRTTFNGSILKNAIYEIKINPLIKHMIISNSVICSFVKIVEETHPDYSNSLGIDPLTIGIYTAFILIFCIIGEYVGSKIDSKYHKYILIMNPFFCGLCILLLGFCNSYLGILFLLIFYLFSESFSNIMFTKVHDSIDSRSRVTVEAIISLILCLFGIVISLISSLLLKSLFIYQLYMILGVVMIIFSIFNLVNRHDYK